MGMRCTDIRWALVACLIALGGCATIGKSFPVNAVSRLEIGQTTMDDVRRLFGEPWRTGLEDGQVTWTYGYYKYTMFGGNKSKDLVVRFDDKKIVTSYTFNTTEPEEMQ
jgi:outer membrane protein assembly factor BamE (lipoprotein component of BamABCDE complex)